MSALNARLRYLFNSYYNQTATREEQDELFQIINASTNNAELTALIQQAWNDLEVNEPLFAPSKSTDMLNNILKNGNQDNVHIIKPPDHYKLWLRLGTAAALMIFLGFGAYVLINKKKPSDTKKNIAKTQPRHDVQPGGNRALLTLANGKTIYLDNVKNGVLAKEGSTQINKTRDGQLVYKGGKDADDKGAVPINTITTPRGGQYQLVLNDGSKVWLNSASSLSFPAVFTGKTRDVEITGEAYFEVAKNAAMPFRVKTNHTVIEVLGTHFNTMAYNDEAAMKTTLLEGSVKISNNNYTSILKPGQQALLNQSGEIRVVNDADAEDSIAWKDGLFQFTGASIQSIMRQAARWYDVEVSYEGQIPVREFTGRISRNVKASELLGMLKYAGVNFKIEDKHITIMQ
ncbi:FecR family protein [Mucilaginibacter sp. RCC_168]|uniref:FecR family protein n=1 Tax=Mucilaginibacter sp. RCC_168 TaxID=3239221 RepID=UPI0035250A6B